MKKNIFLLCILLINLSLFATEEITLEKRQVMTEILSRYETLCNDFVTQDFMQEDDQQKNAFIENATTLVKDLKNFFIIYQNTLTEREKETIPALLNTTEQAKLVIQNIEPSAQGTAQATSTAQGQNTEQAMRVIQNTESISQDTAQAKSTAQGQNTEQAMLAMQDTESISQDTAQATSITQKQERPSALKKLGTRIMQIFR